MTTTTARRAAWQAITGILDAKLTAAGGRCECTGQCGRDHLREHDGRCHTTHGPGHRLTLAAPGLPRTAATRLPSDALTLWCGPCLAAAERAARRVHADAHAATQFDLLGSDPDPPSP